MEHLQKQKSSSSRGQGVGTGRSLKRSMIYEDCRRLKTLGVSGDIRLRLPSHKPILVHALPMFLKTD